MTWFLDLTTRSKLLTGFGLMALLLVAVGITAWQGMRAMETSLDHIYGEDFADVLALKDIRSNQNAIEADLFGIMLSKSADKIEVLRRDMVQRQEETGQLLEDLMQRHAGDPVLRPMLEEFSRLRDDFQHLIDSELVPRVEAGKVAEARRLIEAVEGINGRQRTLAATLVEESEASARRMHHEADSAADHSLRLFAAITLGALLLGLLAAVYLSRIIASPLRETSDLARRVAAGELTVETNHDGRKDEIGELSRSFRTMVDNLRRLATELNEGITVLASAASEIVASTTQIASGAAETNSAVSETTSTVEEVKQTAQVSNEKAKAVSETAQSSARASQNGRQAVDESIAGMNRIREQMESIAESIVNLSEQSQAVGEIIATVNDLAEQSNLLAVNASIEAAKAGEQGKGFAVVAQEIRSLAGQSRQATAQVRGILNDIQKGVSSSVLATEQGSKAVEKGVQQATEAGETIRLLAESITEAAQAAVQIAASSHQQLAGMDQVAVAMGNIEQASSNTATSTRQAESSAQNLHELGQKLKELIAQFKL